VAADLGLRDAESCGERFRVPAQPHGDAVDATLPSETLVASVTEKL
jgi:hypothetical protein